MKRKRFMIITFSIIGLMLIIFIAVRINASKVFSKEVKSLFTQATETATLLFDKSQLDNLPEPVQRYFKHVLKEGQPYISYVRLKHDGQFKTDLKKDWVNIDGEQYFTTETPGFIWKGTTSMFTARDMYIADTGRLVVSLFSVYNIVDSKGEKFNQGELLRWLGESVWFPTNLLPNKNLQWTPIDSVSAKLTFSHNTLTIFYIVTFNKIGEITQLETKRYMGNESLETWLGKLTDYKEINGILIPTRIEAVWKLAKADFSYAKFNITEIEYNKAEKF